MRIKMKRTKNNSKVEGSGNSKPSRYQADPKSNEGEIPVFSRNHKGITLDNDESQRDEGDQLTEKRSDKSEEKERNNNGHVEGEAAEVYEHKDNADEVKTHTQSGTDRQEAQQTDVSSAATVEHGTGIKYKCRDAETAGRVRG